MDPKEGSPVACLHGERTVAATTEASSEEMMQLVLQYLFKVAAQVSELNVFA